VLKKEAASDLFQLCLFMPRLGGVASPATCACNRSLNKGSPHTILFIIMWFGKFIVVNITNS